MPPGHIWVLRLGEIIMTGETKELGENPFSATVFTINPT
jgi:hypothetical protein